MVKDNENSLTLSLLYRDKWYDLTHCGLSKLAAILQMAFSNAFLEEKNNLSINSLLC